MNKKIDLTKPFEVGPFPELNDVYLDVSYTSVQHGVIHGSFEYLGGTFRGGWNLYGEALEGACILNKTIPPLRNKNDGLIEQNSTEQLEKLDVTKPLETVNGERVVFLEFDDIDDSGYPILTCAYKKKPTGSQTVCYLDWSISKWYIDGRSYYDNFTIPPIHNVKEKKTLWVNVYDDFSTKSFSTENEANEDAAFQQQTFYRRRIACKELIVELSS